MSNLFKPTALLLLSILTFNSILFSGNENMNVFKIDSISEEIKLNKFWKYHPGDDTLWAAYYYDDSAWDTLQTTLNLAELPEDQFNGMGWFRLHIQIDSSLRNKTFALTIDQQGASEIYLNGELIASHGTLGNNDKEEKTFNPKYIPFLIQFHDTLDYILAIRYSNLKASENYRIYNKKDAGFTISLIIYKAALNQVTVIGSARNVFLAIFTVFISIAFLHLLLFLFYRRQKSNLYFFLFMLAVSSMWLIVLYTFTTSTEPGLTMKISFYLRLIMALSFPFLSIFIYSIFYPKFPKISWFVLGFIPLFILFILIHAPWTTKVVSPLNLLILIDIIRNIIRAIRKKKSGAWIIGAGFILFIIFFIMAAIASLTASSDIIASPGSILAIVILSTFIPGLISIPVSMSIYLARDFARTNKNLEKQLVNVKILSAKTIEQEHEKQRILENQKEKLEVMVDERTKELALEKEKTEELLLNTLPLKVVNELKENGKSEPESFDNVTVYFSDIVGFTNISSTLDPKALIGALNEMFTVFDDIMVKNSCERIKTIGDAYLAVSGMPLKNNNHAENMVKAAIEIKNYLENRNNSSEVKWQARIGIHTGKVVGGIVGVRKYIYDVFGDTINTASRMESNSEPMRINVSETTYNILKGKYSFIERETINVKGKGDMKMFFLDA